jgi:hypothetical protein
MGNRHAVGRRKSVRRTGEVEALCDRLHPVVLREPWFAINAIDDDTDDGPGIIVILSDAVADRVTAMGRTAGIERIGKRRSITAIGLPTSEEEFQALQRLLEVIYAAAFEPSN